MKKFFGIVALAGIAAVANAQTATYTWQVSGDNGVTWGESAIGNGATVNVRLLASWTGITPGTGVGYAGGQFDATVMPTSAGIAGVISNIVRPIPFNFAAQTLVASAFAGGTKIDTSVDVSAPGAGTGWVNPGQGAHFANPNGFNSTNGAVVFSYDILTTVNIESAVSMVLNPTNGRAMAVYSNETGTQVRIDDSATTVAGARILVPTPGSLALLGLGGLAAARRRR